jgi:hypothetical protein
MYEFLRVIGYLLLTILVMYMIVLNMINLAHP